MAINIFEMFGKIGADNKEAINAIDETVSRAKQADHTISDGLGNIGGKISSAGSKLTSMITKPAIAAATALTGITLVKGFDRLIGIDDARAKLQGLGHDAESVEVIMDSALASVKGTSFGLGEAATTAANAVAAGIEPGEKLTQYLKTTADAAAIAGINMDEMGSIVNKVTTSGRAMTENLEQLSDRGLPIYQWLAKEANVAASEVKDLASSGKISSEMFLKAIESNIGGAAAIIGETSFRASLDNIWASVGRIGANFLDAGGKGGGFFSQLKPLMVEFRELLEGLEDKASEFGEKFGAAFATAVNFVKDLNAQFDGLSPEMQSMVTQSATIGAGLLVGLGPALQIAGKVTTTLSPLARGFETASAYVEGFGDVFTNLPSKTSGSLSKAGSTISGFVQNAQSHFNVFKTSVDNLGGGSANVLGKLFPDSLTQNVSSFTDKLKNIPTQGIQALGDKVGEVSFKFDTWAGRFDNSGIYGKIDGLKNKIGGLTPGIQRVADGAGTMLSQGTSAVSGVVSQTTSALTSVMGVALKLLGPGIILGALLAGLGLLQSGFGDQINQIAQMAISEGPKIIEGLISGLVSKIPDLIQQGSQLLTTFLEVITVNLPVLLAGGVQIVQSLIDGLVSALPSLIPAVIQLVGALAEAIIVNAPLLLIAGLDLLQGLIDGFIQNLPLMAQTVMQLVTTLGTTLTTQLPVILTKGIEILVSIINGIVQAIPQLIPIVIQLIGVIANALLSNLPTIIQGGIQILNALINGVVQIIPQLIPMVAQIFTQILSAIVSNLPQILQSGIQLLGELAAGVIRAIPEIVATVPQIFSAFWDAITSVDWLSIGGDIIAGIASGIGNAAGALWDAAKGVLGGFKDKVLDFFGIHSPSRWGRDMVGKMIPRGIAGGIEDDSYTMQDALTKAASALTFDTNFDTNLFNPNALDSVSGVSAYTSTTSAGPSSQDITNNLLQLIIEILYQILEKDPDIILDGDSVVEKLKERISTAINKMNKNAAINSGLQPRPEGI